MSARYYFHGDETKEEPGKYYCAYCDLLVEKEHFSTTSHPGTDREKYEQSVRDWKELGKKRQAYFHKENNAFNLFASLPKSKKPYTTPFYRWLLKQQNRNDPIGDLAKDVLSDKSFPAGISSLREQKEHLIKQSACDEAIQALEEAYAEFKDNSKARTGLSLSLRFDIFRRDNYRCKICGNSASDGARLEIDHKIPVAKGGSDEISNLWTLCFKCNRGKGTKNL